MGGGLTRRRPGPATLGVVVVLQNVSKSFQGPRSRVVLRDLTFTLATGDYVAVMGESGIGKSTLLNLIAGLEPIDAGSIRVDDQPLERLDDDALTLLRRKHMGFVFQAFHVLSYLDVAANVGLPLELLRWPAVAARARVTEMLAAVGLAERADAMPRELSGGELQRVAIARALVHRPGLVLADEPTGNLDPQHAREVLTLMRNQIKASGASGLLITHSEAAARSADRIFVLREDGLHERIEEGR
jgi:putative ABC transport system ATP-binding protein